MLVLGVESSCDETALALVNEAGVVASAMSTQVDLHALFGGVVPELASREHARFIGPLWDDLWRRAFPDLGPEEGEAAWQRVDRVAVARGPGLLGSLLVGVAFAKALAVSRGLPLVGVNHLHAHLLVAGLPGNGGAELEFPALGVLVSGGHTHLYRMESPWSMTAMGRTLDDAAGEACDKFAKMAGLPYPGGALLDALGKRGKADPRMFPRPYVNNDNLNFSFSGLKTAGALWLQQHPDAFFPHGTAPAKERLDEAPQVLCDAAASFLLAVAETLAIKAERAMEQFFPRCIVVAGGVAANSVVRRVFGDLAERKGIPLLIPPLSLCTDNGVMIAWNGLLLAKEGFSSALDMPAVPRGKPIPNDLLRV